MKLKTILILTTFFIFSLFSCSDSGESIFTDETFKDTIKQNIGGSLIRNIHHYNDFHSYNYDIEYSYKDKNDSIYRIGLGSFYAQEPPKDEQIFRFGKWKIFKTSGDRDKDLLFISNSDTKGWDKFEISPESIEQTALWKEQKIDSELDNWDTVSKIKSIDKYGRVTVLYTYAKKDRIFSFVTGKRKVIYQINLQTGRPEMVQILKT